MSSTSAKSKHLISLDQAKKATKKYRADHKKFVKDEYHKKAVLPICETFERSAFDTLLAQPGCVGVRCYYAMDDDMNVHLVVVGVNEKDEDMIPSETTAKSADASFSTMSEAVILDNTTRCPVTCPPSSTLNTD